MDQAQASIDVSFKLVVSFLIGEEVSKVKLVHQDFLAQLLCDHVQRLSGVRVGKGLLWSELVMIHCEVGFWTRQVQILLKL